MVVKNEENLDNSMRKRSSKFSGVTFEWKTSCFVFKHSQFGFVKNEKTDCICV